MTLAGKTHYDAMMHIMDYCVTIPERGLVLKPFSKWDGISTDYKCCPYRRRSITGCVVYLNGATLRFGSSTQKVVNLSRAEAELNAEVMGVQDALFVRNILKSL